jgi:hypothetical protein
MFPGFQDIGAKYGPFDLVAMESGAYDSAWPDVHIGPEQAIQAFELLKGKVFLPIHWATFDLAVHNWTEPGERILASARTKGIHVCAAKTWTKCGTPASNSCSATKMVARDSMANSGSISHCV